MDEFSEYGEQSLEQSMRNSGFSSEESLSRPKNKLKPFIIILIGVAFGYFLGGYLANNAEICEFEVIEN